MVGSKQFLSKYHVYLPTYYEGHHLDGASLEVVMDKFATLTSLDYNFLYELKHFMRSGMVTMDSIMALRSARVSVCP